MFGDLSLFLVLVLLLISIVLRQGLLFVVTLILGAVVGLTWLWDRYCLRGVEYRRQFSERRAFFGEEIELTLEVVNRKPLPLAWLEIEDEVPRDLAPVGVTVGPADRVDRSLLTNLVALRWYERVRRRYRLDCSVRGYHAFGPARLRSGDIFGLTSQEQVLPDVDHLLVYPKIVPIARLGLPAKDPFGDLRVRQWLFEDPLRTVGVRDYLAGDSPRRIHWKATARAGELQVKVFEPTTTYRLTIFLDLHTTGPHWWWQSYDSSLLELSICAAASVANWAIEQGYQAGLAVNGKVWLSDHQVAIAPSRDPDQLMLILESLAKLVPLATLPLGSLLASESRELPFGATLVVVTAAPNEEILGQLLNLRSAGRRVALCLVGDADRPSNLPGIPIYPIGGPETWREITRLALDSLPDQPARPFGAGQAAR